MYRSSEVFNGRPVVSVFDKDTKQDLNTIAPLMRIEPESGQSFEAQFDEFNNKNDLSAMDTLVIGSWLEDYGPYDNTKPIFELLLNKKSDLPALKALFVGDIAQEESEISWIEISNLTSFLENFSELEYFRVRGAGSFLSTPLKHASLKKLAFETGGLSSETISQLAQSELPNLESLELWLGDEGYGAAGLDDVKALIDVLPTLYPKLRYLGLRNAELADEVAEVLAKAPILNKLEALDMSLGALTDKGAKALLESTQLTQLKELDVHYHFIESDDLLRQLKAKFPKVDVSDQQEADVYDGHVERYIFVAE